MLINATSENRNFFIQGIQKKVPFLIEILTSLKFINYTYKQSVLHFTLKQTIARQFLGRFRQLLRNKTQNTYHNNIAIAC